MQDRIASGAQLSPTHIFALHLYTLYCSIFRDTCKAMRDLDWGNIKAWRPFIYYLDRALYQLNTASSIVFRGLKLFDADGKVASFLDGKWPPSLTEYQRQHTPKYHSDNIIMWPAFSSTSLDYRIALGYASRELKENEAAIILKIQTQRAKPVESFSYFQYERELLYAPNAAFRVTGLWEPSSFNLRQGVQLEAGGPFTLNIDELTQGMLSLDEARGRRELLITMVEEALDPDLEEINASEELSRRKYFEDAHHGAPAATGPAATTPAAAPPPTTPPTSSRAVTMAAPPGVAAPEPVVPAAAPLASAEGGSVAQAPSPAPPAAPAALPSAHQTLETVLSQVFTSVFYQLGRMVRRAPEEGEAALRRAVIDLMVSELRTTANRMRSGHTWRSAARVAVDEPSLMPDGRAESTVEALQVWMEALMSRACEALVTISDDGLAALDDHHIPDAEVAVMLDLVGSHMHLQSLKYR